MSSSGDNHPRFAVVGNPIHHSLSPTIHQAFAEQANISLDYESIELPVDGFDNAVRNLQQQGYRGLNVTVPFKQAAWRLCDRKSPRAGDAGAVNTIIFLEDGSIAGDNTDGVGLTRDLVNNHRALINRRKILLLGAGGAVRGVLPSLLALGPDKLTLANRTLSKAVQLADELHDLGDINACTFEDLKRQKFDLIINGTAAGLSNEVPALPDDVLGINSICYDMMYNVKADTAFVEWARVRGASMAIDGLGMLVEQAAESFFIWHALRVDTNEVIHSLRC